MKAHPPRPLSAWLAERAADSDRLRPTGQDPADDHLETQARADTTTDRADDHTPVTR